MTLAPVLLAAAFVAASWLAIVAFFGKGIPLPPSSSASPAASREEALGLFEQLRALDGESVAAACHSRLLEAEAGSDITVIIWHGFTNCPAQFESVAERFAAEGYNVLLARMPRHGLTDVLNRGLLELTTDELVSHTDACVDIAAGLGTTVWVVGFSAGGVLAAWAAATRDEVRRVVLAAPFVAPKGIPLPVVRLLVRFRSLIPAIYFWWDPRKKEHLGESPYVYPGFPLPGMVPFLHLAETLYDGKIKPTNHLRRAVLLSNPGDFAIRRDIARKFFSRVFDGCTEMTAEATLDSALGWWHDFIDPWGPHVGPADQVAEVFLAALGAGADSSARGAIIAPLPELEPDGSDGNAA